MLSSLKSSKKINIDTDSVLESIDKLLEAISNKFLLDADKSISKMVYEVFFLITGKQTPLMK